MKSSPEILAALNRCLKDQLTEINQFFLHARIAKHWGLSELNGREYKYSIKAMKQADDLIERILFLDGLPNLQDLDKLYIGETVEEILSCDMKLLHPVRDQLVATVKLLEDTNDFNSRELVEKLLEETEEQIDWIETQQWLISNSGVENYIQSQI